MTYFGIFLVVLIGILIAFGVLFMFNDDDFWDK